MVFPNDFPPSGLNNTYKLILYIGVLYIFATILSSWLITRRRSIPKQLLEQKIGERPQRNDKRDTSLSGIPTFERTKDMLATLKVEISGAEASLVALNTSNEKNEISNNAFEILREKYNNDIEKYTSKLNEMLKSDMTDRSGKLVEGISDDAMREFEDDLERQLQDLESDDDFLKPKTRPRSKIAPFPDQSITTPVKADIEQQTKVEPIKEVERKAPTPSIPTPTPPIKPIITKPTPTPVEIKEEAPKPVIPKSISNQQIPSPQPVKQQPIVSKPVAPRPVAPKPVQPSVAQPMKVETDNEGIFAKSTSIAALRMDMLRELARLKKLINEDEK